MLLIRPAYRRLGPCILRGPHALARRVGSTPGARQEAALLVEDPVPYPAFSPAVIRPLGIVERLHVVMSDLGHRATGVCSMELSGPRLSDGELLARFRQAAAQRLARQGELSIAVHREYTTAMGWTPLPYVDLFTVVRPFDGSCTEAAQVEEAHHFEHCGEDPLWRVRVGTDQTTGKQYATFAFSHTLLDATGGVQIALDLFRDAIASRTVSDVPDFIHDFSRTSLIFPATEELLPEMLAPAAAPMQYVAWSDRLAGAPAPGHRSHMTSLSVPESTLNGLRKAAKEKGMSVQALLYTSVLAGLHSLDLPDGTSLTSVTPVNCRPLFPPHLVGATNNFGRLSTVETLDRSSSFWDVARTYTAALQAPALRVQAAQDVGSVGAVPLDRWEDVFQAGLESGSSRCTFCVSNLGVVDPPSSAETGLALEAFKIWHSYPWVGQIFPAVSLRGGGLEITHGWAEGALQPGEGQRVDEAVMSVLCSLAAGEVLEGAKMGNLV